MATRQIIKIDEERCTGCGECVPSCAEGALEIVDGKVRVVEDRLCDGLGACLGACPEDALIIEEREAPEFDEEAVEARLAVLGMGPDAPGDVQMPGADAHEAHSKATGSSRAEEAARAVFGGGGCPGARSMQLSGRGESVTDHRQADAEGSAPSREETSLLSHWPVQLGLVNPLSPSFRESDLLIAADCAPVAYRTFHEDFLEGRSVAIACPKLDDAGAHLHKLAELFRAAKPRSVTVAHMEVPCCFGLTSLVQKAAEMAGLEVPIEDVTITVEGGKRVAESSRR